MNKLVLGRGRVKLYHGRALEVLATIPDGVIDSIVTDPPYGISFLNKHWDYSVPPATVWAECLRVLKPGGYLLAFAGTRTQHRMACNIEDGGFMLQDVIMWLYGSGFPKSMDVGKSIDKTIRGVPQGSSDPESINHGKWKAPRVEGITAGVSSWSKSADNPTEVQIKELAPEAQPWQGWGTQLKPAYEPIILAKKEPDHSITYNVMVHGVGALNIDACRIPIDAEDLASYEFNMNGNNRAAADDGDDLGAYEGGWKVQKGAVDSPSGRFPANILHDGSKDVLDLFAKEGVSTSTGGWRMQVGMQNMRGAEKQRLDGTPGLGDTGTPARFFYCAKASQGDRNEGLGTRNVYVLDEDTPDSIKREIERSLSDGYP